MSKIKELVLFIPGLGAKERDEYVTKLTEGMRDYCTSNGIKHTLNDKAMMDGSTIRELNLEDENRVINIREVFWSDLVPSLSSESLPIKIIRGFTLLGYWVFSYDVWKIAKDSKYMFISMIFTIISVMFWYYGAITTALKAIAESPSFLEYPLPESFKQMFSNLAGSFSGWEVWIVASIILAPLPVTHILNISYFTKSYLQNRDSLHHKIYGRISQAVHGINNEADQYDKVTIVAHSFGVVVGTEYLAKYNSKSNRKVQFISLGGPLLVVAAKSDRVAKAISQVTENPNIVSWVDYFSNQDWLCTFSPVNSAATNYSSHPITSSVSFDEKIKGASHDLYFQDLDVLEAIVGK